MPEGQQSDDRLAETLEGHGLERETVLYRETLEEFLDLDEPSGEWSISANPTLNPSSHSILMPTSALLLVRSQV